MVVNTRQGEQGLPRNQGPSLGTLLNSGAFPAFQLSFLAASGSSLDPSFFFVHVCDPDGPDVLLFTFLLEL